MSSHLVDAVCFHVWYNAVKLVVPWPQKTTVALAMEDGDAFIISQVSNITFVESNKTECYINIERYMENFIRSKR